MANANDNTNCDSQRLNVTVRAALEQLIAVRYPDRECSYRVHKATEKGENYIGVVYRVTVFTSDVQQQPVFSLILKVPPANVVQRKQFFARPCFLRESLAYEEFLPIVREFQLSKAIILHQNGFCEYPVCFNSITEELNEAIFMEDLQRDNFKLFDRFRPLDKAHAALIMRAYGKLHAVSFVIKHEQPEKLKRFTSMLDIFEQRKDDSKLGSYFEELKRSTLDSLDAEQDGKYFNVIKKYFEKSTFFDLFVNLLQASKCEPYAVVCHGDCWINNFLFREEEQKPVDVRLIDWQLMRYSTPICDLMYFMFTCTTKEFRRQHYKPLLDIYYEELSDHISRLGCEPEQLFSRAAFEEQLKLKGIIGLLMAMLVLPIITLRAEDTPDLEELSKRIESGDNTDLKGSGLLADSNSSLYQQRMRDVVIDCIDYGYNL